MSSWHSYPKIYNLGHAELGELLNGEVWIQEKVDGSQFSFGCFGDKLKFRSRGREFDGDSADQMFKQGVLQVERMAQSGSLTDGWTYRCEYLNRPKHNALCYSRIPHNNLVLFDVEIGECNFIPPTELDSVAACLEIEPVRLFNGDFTSGSRGPTKPELVNVEYIKNCLDQTSQLGGQKLEGIVIKNYAQFNRHGHVLMGKFVSEAFKEVHRGDWKERPPSQGDVVLVLVNQYRTPARWQKAVQHLRERGDHTGTPKDIGPLCKEVSTDVWEECGDEILKTLKRKFWPQISRQLTSGLAEWYKEQLLAQQFDPAPGIAKRIEETAEWSKDA